MTGPGLQAQVLPLFRTGSSLSSWGSVNQYADDVRAGMEILEDAAADDGPAVVVPVLRKAIRSVVAAYGRAHDGYGSLSMVAEELLDLHARLCTQGPVPVGELVEWMVGFEFDRRRWHDFGLDPADYRDALGQDGLNAYEGRLLAIAAGLPPEESPEQRQVSYRAGLADPVRREEDLWNFHVRDTVTRRLQRLAVAKGDAGLVIARYAGARRDAHRLLATAEALLEIGQSERAIEFAAAATFAGGGVTAVKAGELWAGLLAQHHPERELDARAEVFARFPTSATAARLYEVAAREERWERFEGQVLARLAGSPRDQVLFLLHTLHDPDRAFTAAVELQLPFTEWNDDVWSPLIAARARVDPAGVLPVL